MKSSLLLLLLLPAAFAQVSGQRQGLQVSLSGAAGATRMVDNNFARYHITGGQQSYWNGGGSIGLMLSPHTGLFIGLEYDQFKWKYDIAGKDTVANGVLRQSMVSLPLYLRFVTGSSDHASLFALVGLKMGFLASVTDKWVQQGRSYTSRSQKGYTSGTLFSFLHAGVTLPVSKGVSFSAGPVVQYGISNNFNAVDSSGRYLAGHLLSLALRAGVNVRLSP